MKLISSAGFILSQMNPGVLQSWRSQRLSFKIQAMIVFLVFEF
jgi:hypothetical protein